MLVLDGPDEIRVLRIVLVLGPMAYSPSTKENSKIRNVAFLFVCLIGCGADQPAGPDAGSLESCVVSWDASVGEIDRVGDGSWRVIFRALSDLELVQICAVGDDTAEEIVSLSLHPDPDRVVILGRSLLGTGTVCLTPDQGAFEDISLESLGVYHVDVFSVLSPSQIVVEVVTTDPTCAIERLGQR